LAIPVMAWSRVAKAGRQLSELGWQGYTQSLKARGQILGLEPGAEKHQIYRGCSE
jgi:hypothetical protein